MSDASFDLDAYLARIGYDGPMDPSIDTLRGLHLAHALAIPFENLDILLGRAIRLDLESLQTKLVQQRRGGYCFEHNALFAAMLEHTGFVVTRLAARVRMGRPASDPLPDSHMILAVEASDELWLADVGFGGGGLLLPIPIEPGPPAEQHGRRYRLVEEPGVRMGMLAPTPVRVLQTPIAEGWFDVYAFSLEPQSAIDYEVANWFTSTHPGSPFVSGPVAQRQFLDGWLTLRLGKLTRTYADGRSETTTIGDGDELLAVLAQQFQLAFPPGTRFASRATAQTEVP